VGSTKKDIGMPQRKPIVRVTIEGRSWIGAENGVYGFEAYVDGEQTELRVSEDVAFDLLGTWTLSRGTCLDILRLHRTDLAQNLERKLRLSNQTDTDGRYSLALHDIKRIHPAARDKARSAQPTR
jgi:hypothetical protein